MNYCQELKEYFQKTATKFPLSKYGKTFSTCSRFYFFDSGTSKILECNPKEYNILAYAEAHNKLDFCALSDPENQEACKNILMAIKNEHIYQALTAEFPHESIEKLEKIIPQNIRQVVLEVTNRCNLRCDYCIYQSENIGFRDFGNKDMDCTIAFKAIDLALNNSYRDDLYIGFYGGEPLLNFDLIKKSVAYALEKATSKKISFSMTTNGVLMSKEKAEYFASIPNFSITFSLDGGKEIHDLHRKLPDGIGSFDAAYKGLSYALEAYKDKRNLISISTVICPPYTEDKFNKLQSFFGEALPDISFNCTYVQNEFQSSQELQEEKNGDLSINERMPLLLWEKKKNASERRKSFQKGNQISQLIDIHNRTIQDQPFNPVKFNGCCLPGTRRLYVTTEGLLLPCERIGKCPDIGNVYSGLNIPQIKKSYIDEYIRFSTEDCSNCWVYPLCGVCYANCFDETGLNMVQKRQLCKEQRLSTEQYLSYYCELSESDPEFINNLNKMVTV